MSFGRQTKMILDSLVAPIVDEARAYPELRNSLASASMGSLRLVDHVLPREDALCALEKTRMVFEKLACQDATDLRVRDYLARCLGAEANLLLELGRLAEAEARHRRSLAEWRMYNAMTAGRPQANRSSAHEVAREQWIDTSLVFSELEARLGRRAEAIASLRQALPIAEELLQDQPGSAPARRRLIVVCSTLATLQDDDEPVQPTSDWRRPGSSSNTSVPDLLCRTATGLCWPSAVACLPRSRTGSTAGRTPSVISTAPPRS